MSATTHDQPRLIRLPSTDDPTPIVEVETDDGELTLVRGERVRRGVFPAWVRKLQEEHAEPGELPFHNSWLDHCGTIPSSEVGEVFVSEPYDLTPEDVHDLVEDAERFEFDFLISATSFHFPTRTVRVLAWRR